MLAIPTTPQATAAQFGYITTRAQRIIKAGAQERRQGLLLRRRRRDALTAGRGRRSPPTVILRQQLLYGLQSLAEFLQLGRQ